MTRHFVCLVALALAACAPQAEPPPPAPTPEPTPAIQTEEVDYSAEEGVALKGFLAWDPSGTAHDPADPVDWVHSVGGKLPPSVFVGHEGAGPTGYGTGNACIDDVVDAYFLEGRVPEDEMTC